MLFWKGKGNTLLLVRGPLDRTPLATLTNPYSSLWEVTLPNGEEFEAENLRQAKALALHRVPETRGVWARVRDVLKALGACAALTVSLVALLPASWWSEVQDAWSGRRR